MTRTTRPPLRALGYATPVGKRCARGGRPSAYGRSAAIGASHTTGAHRSIGASQQRMALIRRLARHERTCGERSHTEIGPAGEPSAALPYRRNSKDLVLGHLYHATVYLPITAAAGGRWRGRRRVRSRSGAQPRKSCARRRPPDECHPPSTHRSRNEQLFARRCAVRALRLRRTRRRPPQPQAAVEERDRRNKTVAARRRKGVSAEACGATPHRTPS